MKSYLTTWFLNFKLDVTLTETIRLRSKVLDLRNHGLERCPNFLIRLPLDYLLSVKCLFLQSNLLSYFSRVTCHSLENLKGLTLDYNRLIDLPFDFRHLKNLTILNISHNSFHNVRFFHVVCQLKNLKILWANATGIEEIPIEIGELTNLRILGLRRNRIISLPRELFSLITLRWLTLADNHICEIPPEISNLSHLVHLNFQKNYLEQLPDSFNRLPELQYLFLDHNLLCIDSEFKSFILSLPKLKYCSASGNLSTGNTSVSIIPASNREERTSNESVNQITLSNDAIASRVNSPREENADNTIERTQSFVNSTLEAQHQGLGFETHFSRVTRRETGDELRLSGNEELNETQSETEACEPTHYHEISQECFLKNIRSGVPTEKVIDLTEQFCFDNDSGSECNDNNGSLPVEVIFDCNSRGSHLEYDHEDERTHQRDTKVICGSETGAENGSLNSQHPFVNSATSVPEAERDFASVREASDDNFSRQDYENANTRPELSRRTSGLCRTQEWVLQQQDSQSVIEACTEESRLNLLRRMGGQVNGFINEAAQQACRNQDECGITSTKTSVSLIYIMPHGREPKPYCLNASASFTCNRTVSSSLFIGNTENENSSYSNARRLRSHLDSTLPQTRFLYDSEETRSLDSVIEVGHPNVTESAEFLISSSSSLGNQRISFNLVANDEESNYDPSDWEHSAPSSAIDDQDVITRFAELQDEELEDNEYEPLNELDWRRIIPLALMR